jgi:hypothetical protein
MIKITKALLATIFMAMLMFTSFVSAEGSDFYWKDSYGRGVGTIPVLRCEQGTDKIGALCYKPCKAGYEEAAGDRMACTGKTYLRHAGTGIPTWIKHENERQMYYNKELQKRHRTVRVAKTVTECRPGKVQWGAQCFDPCRTDFHAGGATGRECIANTKIVFYDRKILPLRQYCIDGKVNDAGLCYKPCRSGTKGIGPVCWGDKPSGYEACAAGFAVSKATCGETTASQTIAAGIMAAALCEASGMEACAAAPEVKDAVDTVELGVKESAEYLDIGPLLAKSFNRIDDAVKDIFASGSGGEAMSSISKLVNISEIKMILTGAQIPGLEGQLREIESMTGVDHDLAIVRLAAGTINLSLDIASIAKPATFDNVATHMSQAVLGAVASYAYPVYGQRSQTSLAEVKAQATQKAEDLATREKIKQEAAKKATLGLNQGLTQGQKLISSNKIWEAILQTDGNFVVYENGKKPVWATDTSGHKPVFLILQGDGNLVLYKGTGTGDQGGAIWNSRTQGHNSVFLIMQDDGNLVLYKGTGPVDQGGAIWNSRSFNWKG